MNKSNKLVYCVKRESKVLKDISGEETSCKAPTNTACVFHVETTRTRRFHVVSTSLQHGTHAVYL